VQYSWKLATGYALIGKPDKALNWLENAVRHGLINYPFLAQHDPLLENLRQESRFKALVEDVQSQWERFEV
jgi:hypothetical protein